MRPLKISRPSFPPGYADHPTSEVAWEYVEQKLTEAKHYWLCSVQADSRPHCVPRWAVYLDGRIYYDGSPETRHARNILEKPHVTLHLESGEKAIIMEGESRPADKPSVELAQRLSEAYKSKYAEDGYAPEPDQWDEGGLYVFTPRQCLAWTVFFENPTKFVFEDD
jgi:nitroimidazol reductase NimA-like FMN-containing flavoprotein (pyridoxamine 5'-phosphate oxidase superfamily)